MFSIDSVLFGSDGRYSQYLKKTEVNLISHQLCQSHSYYGKLITDNMLCAGSPDWTTDSCNVSYEQIFATTGHVWLWNYTHFSLLPKQGHLLMVQPQHVLDVQQQNDCYFLTTWRYNNATFSLISSCCVSVTNWCVFTGWLWWSTGVWSLGPDVSVWDCELGWRVCQDKQTRGLHTSH